MKTENPTPSEFQQGHDAGRRDQTLQDHSEHLARINGSMEKVATNLGDLASEVRSLREDQERRQEQRIWRFGRRERLFALFLSACVVILGIVSLLRGWPVG